MQIEKNGRAHIYVKKHTDMRQKTAAFATKEQSLVRNDHIFNLKRPHMN